MRSKNSSNEKKNKKFKLFDMNRDGKGVYEKESRKPTLKFFFVLAKRKFPQLLRLNLILLLMLAPVFVVLGLFLLGTKAPSVINATYVPLYGIAKIIPSPSLTASLDFSALQMSVPVLSSAMNVVIVLMVLITALTFGWQNIGAAYVLRGLCRGDAVFVLSDFIYGIKRNWKQGFLLGLLDFICSAVLIMDFVFFFYRTGSFGTDFMYFTIFAVSLIYLIMRFYIYQLLITFDLSIFKILKNALIFTILGIKRNLMAILGLILLIGLHILLIVFLLPIGISIPLVLPLIYIFAFIGFITTYAAYPIISRYMIEPYQTKTTESESDEDSLDLLNESAPTEIEE